MGSINPNSIEDVDVDQNNRMAPFNGTNSSPQTSRAALHQHTMEDNYNLEHQQEHNYTLEDNYTIEDVEPERRGPSSEDVATAFGNHALMAVIGYHSTRNLSTVSIDIDENQLRHLASAQIDIDTDDDISIDLGEAIGNLHMDADRDDDVDDKFDGQFTNFDVAEVDTNSMAGRLSSISIPTSLHTSKPDLSELNRQSTRRDSSKMWTPGTTRRRSSLLKELSQKSGLSEFSYDEYKDQARRRSSLLKELSQKSGLSRRSSRHSSLLNDSGLTEFSYDDYKVPTDTESTLNAEVVSALRRVQYESDMVSNIQGNKRNTTTRRMRCAMRCAINTKQKKAANSMDAPDVHESFKSSCSDEWDDSFAFSMRRQAMSKTNSAFNNGFQSLLEELDLITMGQDWLSSFRRLDPRYQILKFFNDLALEGVEDFENQGCSTRGSMSVPKILQGFIKCGVFSVWRPTSNEAIRKMITGEGTGKGLDIKGKSAKCGELSGFVPFLQIHENDHKEKVGSMRADIRVRVFYPTKQSRDMAAAKLRELCKSMLERARSALLVVDKEDRERKILFKDIRRGTTEELVDQFGIGATERRKQVGIGAGKRCASVVHCNIDDSLREIERCHMEDPSVNNIDDYAHTQGVFGLDLPEKLLWEGYVVANDITRVPGSKYETGRPSMPEFQQMNIDTLRHWCENAKDCDADSMDSFPGPGRFDRTSEVSRASVTTEYEDADPPRPVLWHGGCGRVGGKVPDDFDPLCPLSLLMAYEESSKVIPVVSDFDCFLLGTRGVKYHEPLGDQELSMLSMCVDEIEGILEAPNKGNWTQRWLEVKKKHAVAEDKGSHEMPRFGYADPRSYKIMTGAVERLKTNGAVRHGPECFNYGFPQDLDDYFLVISDTFSPVPWKYVNRTELIESLCEKISEGFTFPLNPKWVLCDPGWKHVYDRMLASQKPNVQDSLAIWYPDEVRAKIDDISARFPDGFVDLGSGEEGVPSSGVLTDLAVLELKKYMVRMRSKKKVRALLAKPIDSNSHLDVSEVSTTFDASESSRRVSCVELKQKAPPTSVFLAAIQDTRDTREERNNSLLSTLNHQRQFRNFKTSTSRVVEAVRGALASAAAAEDNTTHDDDADRSSKTLKGMGQSILARIPSRKTSSGRSEKGTLNSRG